jgi:hypothetical protein
MNMFLYFLYICSVPQGNGSGGSLFHQRICHTRSFELFFWHDGIDKGQERNLLLVILQFCAGSFGIVLKLSYLDTLNGKSFYVDDLWKISCKPLSLEQR